jgi:hypothetical protein
MDTYIMTTDMVRAYINLTPEDKATLEREYGYGWSTEIRQMIHLHCQNLRSSGVRHKPTIGDLADDN